MKFIKIVDTDGEVTFLQKLHITQICTEKEYVYIALTDGTQFKLIYKQISEVDNISIIGKSSKEDVEYFNDKYKLELIEVVATQTLALIRRSEEQYLNVLPFETAREWVVREVIEEYKKAKTKQM